MGRYLRPTSAPLSHVKPVLRAPAVLVRLPGTFCLKQRLWRGLGVGWEGRRERASLEGLPRLRTPPAGVQDPPFRACAPTRGVKRFGKTH